MYVQKPFYVAVGMANDAIDGQDEQAAGNEVERTAQVRGKDRGRSIV